MNSSTKLAQFLQYFTLLCSRFGFAAIKIFMIIGNTTSAEDASLFTRCSVSVTICVVCSSTLNLSTAL